MSEIQKTQFASDDVLKHIAELQQQSAMQQLEIMRLREALETAVEYQRSDVANFHSAYAGYYDEKHEQYDEDLKMVEQTLFTTTTYNNLMAWHEAQLGEPVAWIKPDFLGRGYAELDELHEYKFLPITVNHNAIPLYVKKG